MDPRSLRVIQNAYLSLLTRAKELLSVKFCDTTENPWTKRLMEGTRDMKSEILIEMTIQGPRKELETFLIFFLKIQNLRMYVPTKDYFKSS